MNSRLTNIVCCSLLLLLANLISRPCLASDLSTYINGTVDYVRSENAIRDDGDQDIYRYDITAGLRKTFNNNYAVSAQGLLAKRGIYGSTYHQLDYLFLSKAINYNESRFLLLSAGRVKIPYGLFNESRDVVFARSSYELPTSIYFDSDSGRNIFFSADGVRLDAYYSWREAEWQASFALGKERGLDTNDKDNYLGDISKFADVDLTANIAAQIGLSSLDGAMELKFSYLHLEVNSTIFTPQETVNLEQIPDSVFSILPVDSSGAIPPSGTKFNTEVDISVLSIRYEPNRLQLISEISTNTTKNKDGENASTKSLAGYFQLGWQYTPMLMGYLRQDRRHLFDDDMKGKRYVEETGRPAHPSYFIRHTGGIEYRFSPKIRGYADLSYNEGTLNISSASANQARTFKEYWLAGTLAIAWRF